MFKARMKFAKEGRAKYISHLDLMHTMQRAMARCQMPLWFTEGFNQHAYVSVALPLSTGYSGECEFLDFNITSESVPINAVEALNDVFPEGLRAIEIYPLEDGGMKVGAIEWSQYRITWGFDGKVPAGFADAVRELFGRPVVEIVKKSKRGEKTVNMKDLMRDLTITEHGDEVIAVVTTAAGNNNMSPEYLTRAIRQYLPEYDIPFSAYHRMNVFTADGTPFR
ncbi:MAG TPA: TIGR03936 family radical SAM-associated protein [Candidatus Agathobaculum intestinigallinarum]|nr:TIGR03936 family radical SAM-associated protein [Candidatus Agathobaculum intestinigallinarum]